MKNEENKEKISVIMCAYNAEMFIAEAIKSIISQTFKEWELIIINDASTDSTKSIIENYQKADNRIKIINLSKNIGPAAARNKGLKIAKGKYLAILDSDDIALPKRLAIQYNYLEKYKSYWIIASSMQIVDRNNKTLGEEKISEKTEMKLKDILYAFIPYHSGIMFRKGLFYRDKLKQAEDIDLFYRTILENKKILAIPEILGKYRLHKDSLTTMKWNQQKKYLKLVKEYAKDKKSNIKYKTLKDLKINELDINKNFEERKEILQKRKRYPLDLKKGQASAAYEKNDMPLFRKIVLQGIKVNGLKAWKNEIPYYFISFIPKEKKEKLKIISVNKAQSLFKVLENNLTEVKKNIENLIKYGLKDPFFKVDIETITYCNRRCAYCPNSIYERSLLKNKKTLDENLFYKIIDELAEIKYKGIINPNFYGEPLSDKRLLKFIRYTKIKLPESKIVIYTNGDFLSLEYYKDLIAAGVNEFIITQHSKKNKKIEEIIDYKKMHLEDNVKVTYCKLKEINNRGGLMASRKPLDAQKCRVLEPRIFINYNGDVILCCQDYHSSIKFGNIKTEKLLDIWKKPEYKRIRENIKKGNFELDICQKCIGKIT